MTYYEEPTPELIELHAEVGYYPKPDDFEPHSTFPPGHKFEGSLRCHAWNAYHGRQCLALAMISVNVNKCRTHGGKSLRGTASPHFVTGRYSKVLPVRLAEKYNNLVESDKGIMDMRTRAELLETRILEIVEKLDSAGSFEIFRQLQKTMNEYEGFVKLSRGASRERQQEYGLKAADALNRLFQLINRGMDDSYKWEEIQTLTESIRKLADTEQRQIKTAETAVMLDRVMVFAIGMGSIFRDAVMALSSIPLDSRKSVLATVEEQVSALLMQGNYPQVIDGTTKD